MAQDAKGPAAAGSGAGDKDKKDEKKKMTKAEQKKEDEMVRPPALCKLANLARLGTCNVESGSAP
jgi:hypothetical protein